MSVFEFPNSIEIEGMTVAVTVAIALVCAHTFCVLTKEIMTNALTMVSIVLIPDVSARTMPEHYQFVTNYSSLTVHKAMTYSVLKTGG
jgi:hypothetical protein